MITNGKSEKVFTRDRFSCTWCGVWLPDEGPASYHLFMWRRSMAVRNNGRLSNYVTVCHTCRDGLHAALDSHHNRYGRETLVKAGMLVARIEDPEDVPVWVETSTGLHFYWLDDEGARSDEAFATEGI